MKTFHGLRFLLTFFTALAVPLTVWAAGEAAGERPPYAASVDKHFHPKGKPPSEHTLALIKAARQSMPFDNARDFDEARKGRFRTVLSNEDSGIQLGFIDIVLRDVGLWHFNAIDQ